MSKRILVVEDQMDNRQILRDLLTSVGFNLVEAEDGAQGVAAAETHRPDLILMDIQMPVLDGYEATRQGQSRSEGDPDHCGDVLRAVRRRGESARRRLR
jgi:two-component system cell cycle response regulator DivK